MEKLWDWNRGPVQAFDRIKELKPLMYVVVVFFQEVFT